MAEAKTFNEGLISVKCFHIHITGRVQGVGFRPYIYRLAVADRLRGWVANSTDGVHIEVEGEIEANEFVNKIRKYCPAQARIEKIEILESSQSNYDLFSIVDSVKKGRPDTQLTPDFALCKDCLVELRDKSDRRHGYPFITCTNCGPRFSITRKLPYDREFTTMSSFNQCDRCRLEFSDPEDRRFYSQTNSCPDCPVHMVLYDHTGVIMSKEQDKILILVTEAILKGKIVAIKGIGGYLLCADATSATTIKVLRERKQRPSKPFALMYPDPFTAEKDVEVNDRIHEEWRSPESPIVLCRLKKCPSTGIMTDLIAPGLDRIGVMMPYAPVFLRLMDNIGKPIVATSGNVSGSPILYRDDVALDLLSVIADLILVNDREIIVPQDDSVVQYTENTHERIILRRSRGMAPSVNIARTNQSKNEVLAMGAMLKSTFGMVQGGRYYISQFLGDTGVLESQLSYETTLDHLKNLLDLSPLSILIDLHPDYPASRLGLEMAERLQIPVMKIQHHEAHSFAVLGENHLLDDEGILSIVWDGTGLGNDGRIWGGEFFDYSKGKHTRIGHWEYFPHILGDKMSLEPRISALCLSGTMNSIPDLVTKKFHSRELKNFERILKKETLLTSSAGRIFDAVSSFLGITDYNTYEGEAAMYLEALAVKYLDKHSDFKANYDLTISSSGIVKLSNLVTGILSDIQERKSTGHIAAKFHFTLVHIIRKFIDSSGHRKIAFSGGVFQNALLVDLILKTLSDKYSVYFHNKLSPNDESIPFGQIMAWEMMKKYKIKD